MAFVFPAGAAAGPTRRFGPRRRGIDWRVVAMTAATAVLLIAMLARPAGI